MTTVITMASSNDHSSDEQNHSNSKSHTVIVAKALQCLKAHADLAVQANLSSA